MSVLANAGPNFNAYPAAQPTPEAIAETTIAEIPGERYLSILDLPKVEGVEAVGHNASVNLSARRPLLSAAEVSRQIPNAGDMLGELIARVEEPRPEYVMDAPSYRMGSLVSQVYVFRRDSDRGPVYTILGAPALGRLADGQSNPEGTIVHLSSGDKPLVVGKAEGNWLPSVGYDRTELGHNSDLARANRTISREQGRFWVDKAGDLHYDEAPRGINAAMLYMHKTRVQRGQDATAAEATAAVDARLKEQRAANPRTELQSKVPHNPLGEANLQPEDLVREEVPSHIPSTRTYGGRLVGERYKGTRRRAGWLGRLATRFFG